MSDALALGSAWHQVDRFGDDLASPKNLEVEAGNGLCRVRWRSVGAKLVRGGVRAVLADPVPGSFGCARHGLRRVWRSRRARAFLASRVSRPSGPPAARTA